MASGRLDVHTHYLGGAVRTWLETSGFSFVGGYQITARWTVPNALDFQDRHDIGTQILSAPWAMVGKDDDPEFAVRSCRAINEDYAALIKDHPDRFGAFAALPMDNPDVALAEIEYALDFLGLDGVLLPSSAEGHYLGQPFFEPILAELSRRQVPVLVHPVDHQHVDDLGFGRPSSVIEFPFDTARAVTNAIYTGVFQRHTGLKLILAHCGGGLPTLGWRIGEHTQMGRGPQDADIDPAQVAADLRGLYYEIALAGSRNSLLPTLEVTGADHILFGTDWPAAPEQTVVHNIEQFVNFDGFSPEQFADVERANAVQLFPRFA
jgi:predicted TIM-barrel fold metal-dependent hydrolase